ncbi:hypothetical protein NM208_g5735 [Fusarium decemcellulare]|uniref:Uncharacterized protein n=1 Tax=Fusarium decemcellulare TaxID=57161 RepID=A0ACC1SG20_9HYPO|nr:hypothetical protein NM208_g5735 [Fusarium decemcellulare]
MHDKNINQEAVANADRITPLDLQLAVLLEPDWKWTPEPEEEDYPSQWATNPRSFNTMFQNFLMSAKKMVKDNVGASAFAELERQPQEIARPALHTIDSASKALHNTVPDGHLSIGPSQQN